MDNNVNREPATETIIRFQDCDPLGHLNNARYLDYFINAREDHLAEYYGLDIFDNQRQFNTIWVVAKTKIAYLSSVIFREKVEICTRLLKYTDTLLLMEGVMTGTDPKIVKSIVWIEFQHFNLAQKRLAHHSEELTALFEKIVFKEDPSSDFDTRIKEICKLSPQKKPDQDREKEVADV